MDCCGDVEEPVKSQHDGTQDGVDDNQQPDSNLQQTLIISVTNSIARTVSVINNNHNNNSKSKVSHGLVKDKDEAWLAADPGLVDGGNGGDDDQQVEHDLGYELQYWDE